GGDLDLAEPMLRRLAAVREKALGPEHPDLANSLARLGSLYIDRGKYREARPVLERAIAIQRRVKSTPESSAKEAAEAGQTHIITGPRELEACYSDLLRQAVRSARVMDDP